jgi:RNA polymerase sigma-70 factor, ECF subfamily
METDGPRAAATRDRMSASADPLHAERPRLFAIAYRMLGSAGEAEDVVQDAYMRWYAQPRDGIANPPAFLTTMVTNLSLDVLKSARRQREEYPGVWLPEPAAPAEVASPEDDLQKLESVSFAFLSLLETLGPLERAIYILADVFDYSHAEVGAILARTPEACRQGLKRARAHLAQLKRMNAPPQRHRELLGSFLTACHSGDIDALTRLLADDVELRGDGGGHANAVAKPLVGVRAVSRLFMGFTKQAPPDFHVRIETVNGQPSALLCAGDVLLGVMQIQVAGGRIARIDNALNPYKLARVAAAFGLRTAAP